MVWGGQLERCLQDRRFLRRLFIGGLALCALLAGDLSLAQRVLPKPVRIGFLRFSDQATGQPYVESLRRGLRELGYLEGKDFTLALGFADGKVERFAALAGELLTRKVDIIVTTDTPATRAAQRATQTVPVVMVNVIDPIGSGFVTSLARPGGNITGLTSMTGDVSAKHLQLLGTVVARLTRIAVLLNPSNPAHAKVFADIRASAEKVGISALAVKASDGRAIEDAFAAMAAAKSQAAIVVADAFFAQQRHQIAERALSQRMPMISANREYVAAGALMSYGQDFQENVRRAALFIDKIVKGAQPADLAIERPTTFTMVINRKTAKTLGLAIPQQLAVLADEIID